MLPADILERYDDVSNEALASWRDEDACECGGLFNGFDPWLVKCDTCERIKEVDRSRAIKLLYDCGSVVTSETNEEFYRLIVFGDAEYEERGPHKLTYKLTASGRRCADKAWRPMSYIEMKRALAKALEVEQEDCRAHDKTMMWCFKLDTHREICVIADNVEDAAEAIRRKLEKTK